MASVLEVKVQPGDRIKPGDVLIVLDDRDLAAQLGEALAAVNAAEVMQTSQRDVDRSKWLEPRRARKRRAASSAPTTCPSTLERRVSKSPDRSATELNADQGGFAGVVADRFADPATWLSRANRCWPSRTPASWNCTPACLKARR